MKRIVRRSIVATGLLVACGTSIASGFSCDGQITSVGVNTGYLFISYGQYGIQSICSVSGTTSIMPPESCRSWLALLLSAQAQGKTVRVYYDSAVSGNPMACTGLQAWGSYAPYFVQTLD